MWLIPKLARVKETPRAPVLLPIMIPAQPIELFPLHLSNLLLPSFPSRHLPSSTITTSILRPCHDTIWSYVLASFTRLGYICYLPVLILPLWVALYCCRVEALSIFVLAI
jgi:hypothetical protein